MAETSENRQLSGIGGWLAVSLVLVALASLYDALLLYLVAAAAATKADGHHVLSTIIRAWERAPTAYFFMFQNYCLVRFVQKRRDLPFLMTVLYGAHAAFLTAFWIAYSNGYAWATRIPVRLYPLSVIVPLVVSLAWVGYYQSSIRVKNTFITLDVTNAATVEMRGIGGALLVPLGFLILFTAIGVYSVFSNHLAEHLSNAVARGDVMAAIRSATGALLLGYCLFCLLRFFQQRREVPWLMIGFCGLITVYALARSLLPQPHWQRGAVLAALACVLISAYFLTSKRVKNTFVR